MEENEIIQIFIKIMTISFMETISHPLFSCIISLYTIILLYFPQNFLQIALSPVLILTAILLLSLLRLGATQRIKTQNQNPETISPVEENLKEADCFTTETDANPGFEETFVEWDMRAPLEVIYEDEEDEDEDPKEKVPMTPLMMRHPSLSGFYPETDSDSSSDADFAEIGNWVSPEDMCFRWEEEDREELIEIALDGDGGGNNNKSDNMGFHVEEENLIEIDISPLKK